MAANMNKVEVTFDADVNHFTRGVDRMERKLKEFDKQADRTESNVGKRFDLMDGSLRKVEKRLDGFGDNMEMKNVQEKLHVAQKEFKETGNVGYTAMRDLEKAVNDVDLSKLDDKNLKAFKHLDSDVKKLGKSLNDLDKIRFAEGMEGDSKVMAMSFLKLRDSINHTSLSTRNLKKSMGTNEFNAFSKKITDINGNMMLFEKELRETGKVSNATFYKLKNDIKDIDFKTLPPSAARAFGSIRKHTQILSKDFDRMGTHITANQLRFNKFRNATMRSSDLIRRKFDETMNTFNRWGVRFRNIAEVGQHVFGGVLIPVLSSIVPVAGTATTAVMGIGAGLGAAGGAMAGFLGVMGIAQAGIRLFAFQAKTALEMLEEKEIKVTQEIQRYQQALKGLENQWKNVVKANQAQIFNTMTNGINMARNALTRLNPFITKTAKQIEIASGKMHKWVTSSSNAKAAFELLNKRGPAIFQNVLNAGGHLGNGLTRIFVAFGPLFTWFGQGLESMAKKFDKWANSVGTQSGIKDFIEFTKRNMPILGSIFGNTFMGIINLFKAFSGQTEWAMKGLEKMTVSFNNWAKNLSKTQGFKDFISYTRENAPMVGKFIGNLVLALVAFVKAIAPISAFMLKITTSFLGWIDAQAKAHPLLARLTAGVILFFGALKSLMFISAIVSSFINLRKVMTLLIGTQKLGAIANGIFTASAIKQNGILKTLRLGFMFAMSKLRAFTLATILNTKTMVANMLASKAWALASKGAALAARGLGLAIRFMTGPVGMIIMGITALVAIIIHLWKTNSTFRNGVIAIWNSIKNAAIAVFGFLKPYILGIWNGIKTATLVVWNAIKWVVSGVWNGIASLFKKGGMKSAVINVWNGIKTATFAVWNAIKNVVLGVANAIKNGVVTAIRWAVVTAISLWRKMASSSNPILRAFAAYIKLQFTIIKTIVNAVITFVKNVNKGGWTYIKTIAIKMVSILVAGVKRLFGSVKAFILSTLNSIRSFTLKVWTSIKVAVIKLVTLYVMGVRRNFTILRNFITSTFTKIKNFFVKIWTTIKNFVVKMAQSIWTNVRNKFTGLYKTIRSIFNSISNFSRKLWTALKNAITKIAQQLWNNLKSKFNGLYKTIRTIFNAVKAYLSRTWTSIRNYVTTRAKELWNNLRRKFRELQRGTSQIFNSVKNSMIKTWRTISSTVSGIAKGLWSKVGNTFRTMRDGLKGIIGKIKSHIDSMVTKVKKGLNKLIDGVNWVATKIGMDKLPTFKFSTGTTHTETINRKVKTTPDGRLKQPTRAIVGDRGRGNGPNGFRNELIEYPNGKFAMTPSRDTEVMLPANSRVHNGTATYNALKEQNAPMPRFSTGTLPRFADGSLQDQFTKGVVSFGLGAEKKKKEVAAGAKALKATTEKKAGDVKAAVKGGIEDTMAFGKDIFDFATNPKKLVSKVMDKFGVNFDFAKGGILGGLVKAAYKKLQDGVKELFSGWLEDGGGGADGSSFTKYAITTPYSPNKAVAGYGFNGGRHYGIDYATPVGTTLTAPTGGTISKLSNYGGGTVARLLSGKFTQFFMHLKDIFKTGKVKQGEKFAHTGNSGHWTTGPHLHYQVEKGRSADITNRNTIDPEKFMAGSGGGNYGSGSAAARKIIKRAQAIMGGKFKSSYVTEQMMRLAKRESNFDVNAVNNWDVNAQAGNPSRGMFQMIKTTFDAFKTKGHGNYKNPVDQAVAVLNYINKKYSPHYGFNGAFKRSADRAYESGGFANFPQIAWLAEGGFSESIISHDPANKVKSKAIHDRTGELLGFNEEPELLRRLITLQENNNDHTELIERHTRATADKEFSVNMDGKRVSRQLAPNMRKELKEAERRVNKFRA